MSEQGANDRQRIEELETRLTFQEQALVELSDALAAARADIALHEAALRRVVEELKSARGSGVSVDPADEPPPPHY
ncbi:MAG: SlyX family protein [Xanthomonadales bacterium]|nr:SlyX family protein [Xanthomonadales bacterium]